MARAIEMASFKEVLERQLTLLRALANELLVCRDAYVSMNLEAIYSHLAKQISLCDELRRVEADRSAAWRAASSQGASNATELPAVDRELNSWMAALEPEVTASVRRLLKELELVEGQVRHLNRVQMVLLDGSRRTLNILSNALGAFSATYARPAFAGAAGPQSASAAGTMGGITGAGASAKDARTL